MAICDDVPGVMVKVIVAGKDAAEYDDEDGPQEDKNEMNALNRVFKFIESEDDAAFSIHCSVDHRYAFEDADHRLHFSVRVDGQIILKRLLGHTRPCHSSEITGHVKSNKKGKWQLRPLKFATITTVETTEKARVKKDLEAAKSVGLIQVCVTRCKEIGKTKRSSSKRDVKDGPKELAEKALKGKAVSHGLSFGASVRTDKPYFVESEKLDNGQPFVVFDFKYRSRESLQKLMVIPRTPSPNLVEEINSLSEEAIRELALRQLQRDRASSTDTIKVENGTVIKREVREVYDLTSDTPQGRRKRKRIETIDLTDD